METTLERVTNCPVVAIETGLGDPKNVAVTSSRNMLVIVSIIMVDKKAIVKEGTNSLPAEDSSFKLCCNFRACRVFPNDSGKCSAVNLLCSQQNK
jgi:hypothetical protein